MDISFVEERLSAALVSGAPKVKVAMLVSRAFRDSSLPEDEAIGAALDALMKKSDIETFGNIHNWRRSETRRLS